MLRLAAAMLIFGTIGAFRRNINLSSGMFSFGRAVTGTLFLVILARCRGGRVFGGMTRRQIVYMILSGLFMGGFWLLFFEAYCYTTVAVVTLCAYMQPTIVLLLSYLLFGERLSRRRLLCAALALLGMALVSGIADGGRLPQGNGIGVLLALASACCYAAVVLLNKKAKMEDAYAATAAQLLSLSVLLIPWLLLTEDVREVLAIDLRSLLLWIATGLLHTGIAYALYFANIGRLPAQSVAMFAYLDPLSALLTSTVFLREPISVWGMLGAALILGAAIVSEALPAAREKNSLP